MENDKGYKIIVTEDTNENLRDSLAYQQLVRISLEAFLKSKEESEEISNDNR